MISLIIPMYNSEQTIRKTLESVVNQTVAFAEVIIVDNGSSDESVQIVHTFCEKYSYIRLIDCKVRGVSAARNTGMKEAQSDYIAFLDSDDLLESDYVETLIAFILNHPDADMYHFNFYQQFKNGIIKENQYFLHDQSTYTGQEFMEQTLTKFSFEAKHMVWTFIFYKPFLLKNSLSFLININILEDVLFLQQIWRYNPQIYVIHKPLILYCYNKSSLTNQLIAEDLYEILQHEVQLDTRNILFFLKFTSRIFCWNKYYYLWKDKFSVFVLVFRYVMYKVMYTTMKIKRKFKTKER